MLKKTTQIVVLLTVLVGVFYGYLLWNNNRQVEAPSLSEIQAALASATGWMKRHEEKILNDNNPMLWWMVQQSAVLTGDPDLRALFAKYKARYLENRRDNMWRPLFAKHAWVPVRYEDIAHLPYYNKHFIFALSCDDELGKRPEIAAQNAPDFCDAHPLRPACVTHQLMGIRIMQRKACGDQGQLATVVAALQDRIVRQLTWDPRVVDVYLQRVLMLLESGAAERVKPIWLRHVLEAQSDDGGWGPFEPLIGLPGGPSFGFSAHGFSIRESRDTFHTTAQGLFIMSLLANAERGR